MTFSETILNLVTQLQNLDFELVAKVCAGYIAIIWFITTLWIFFDARQRYPRLYQALLVTFFTSIPILGFPFLILYVVMRPEHTKYEFEMLSGLQREWSAKKALPFVSKEEQKALPQAHLAGDENMDLSKMTKKERRRYMKQSKQTTQENTIDSSSSINNDSTINAITDGVADGEVIVKKNIISRLKEAKANMPSVGLKFK